MHAIHSPSPYLGGDHVLLIMLPGVNIPAEHFITHGFAQTLHQHPGAIDVIALRPDVGLYLDGTLAETIHTDIIVPALARGYRRIWFAGISLGGMGALLYAQAHRTQVEGIILLAPFVGTPGLIAEIVQSGGLTGWNPGEIAASDRERALLAWLKEGSNLPKLYLGYGRQDRFAMGHAMVADHLPSACVVTRDGGHDWQTWSALWHDILKKMPFDPISPKAL